MKRIFEQVHIMTSKPFLHLSGVALCVAGAAYFADTLLDAAAPMANPGIGGFVPLFGLIGFPGFWLSLRNDSVLSLLAFGLTMAGLAGLMIVTFLMNFLFPALSGAEIGDLVGILGVHLKVIGVLFLISAILTCAVTWCAGRQERLGGVIYALGAVPLSLPPLMPPIMQDVGALLVGAGLLIWGTGLSAARDNLAEAPTVQASS